MAANMTDAWENDCVDAQNGVAALTQVAAANLKLRFHTGAGATETGLANPLAAGGDYLLAGITITLGALVGLVGKVNAFSQDNLPAATITGFSIWDGTTAYIYGPYSKTFGAGQDITFTGNDFVMTFQGEMTEALAGHMWDALSDTAAYNNPAPRLGAHTASPGTTGAITNEALDANYARTTYTVPAASGGSAVSSADAELGTGFAGSETLTHISIIDNTASEVLSFDVPTGGSLSMTVGVIARVKSGELTVSAT